MNVVSIMAHQDDELMCLGTMLKMKVRDDILHFIIVTDGSCGMIQAPEMSREEAASIRDNEMRALCNKIDASYCCLGEQDEFLYDTIEVRNSLIDAIRATRADVIFTHNSSDYNLDHTTVNQLVRQCAMQGPFPMIKTAHPPLEAPPAVFLVEPASGFEFQPSHYVDITEQIALKRELALCHTSQDEAFCAGMGKGLDDWICETSSYRGAQVGVPHAEGFIPMYSRGLVKAYSILP